MKIDVVLLTKNSVNPCLKECLESIRKQLPINRLIIVDGGSTDGTIELCKAIFPAAQIIYDVKGNRATARQIGIDRICTDWFVFMDSDVILKDDWFKNASKYMVNPDIGAVQGATLQIVEPVIEDFSVVMKRARKFLGGLTYKPFLEPEHRGFTGDILLKTHLVKDIKIPKILHVYEDHYIKKWIENKGFIWFRAPDAMCAHYMENRDPKTALNDYIGYVIGSVSFKRSFVAVLMIIPKILFALCMKPNFKMAVWQLKFQLYSFIGVTKARLTAQVRRDIQQVMKFKYGTRKEQIKDYKTI